MLIARNFAWYREMTSTSWTHARADYFYRCIFFVAAHFALKVSFTDELDFSWTRARASFVVVVFLFKRVFVTEFKLCSFSLRTGIIPSWYGTINCCFKQRLPVRRIYLMSLRGTVLWYDGERWTQNSQRNKSPGQADRKLRNGWKIPLHTCLMGVKAKGKQESS